MIFGLTSYIRIGFVGKYEMEFLIHGNNCLHDDPCVVCNILTKNPGLRMHLLGLVFRSAQDEDAFLEFTERFPGRFLVQRIYIQAHGTHTHETFDVYKRRFEKLLTVCPEIFVHPYPIMTDWQNMASLDVSGWVMKEDYVKKHGSHEEHLRGARKLIVRVPMASWRADIEFPK